MLTIYRRHQISCEHRKKGRKYRRCKCPLWGDGLIGNREIRKSLRMRDWDKAQALIRKWEAESSISTKEEDNPITISEAWGSYLRECKVRGLSDETIRKYNFIRKQMGAFASGRGLKLLTDFVLEVARDFLATWTNKNLSALKKLELLRAFFRFAQDSGWVPDNPARKIKNPKVTERQTLPFEQDETIRMIECCSGPKKARLRALVLLLRYSGLRIRTRHLGEKSNQRRAFVSLHLQSRNACLLPAA